MKNAKSLSVVLVLPLLLAACNKAADTTQPTDTTPPVPTPITEEPATEPTGVTEEVEVETPSVEVSEDQIAELPPAEEAQTETVPEPTIEEPVEPEESTSRQEPEPTPEVVIEPEPEPEPEVEAGLTGTFVYNTDYPTPKGVTAMDTTFVVENGVVQSFSLVGNPEHQTSIDHQVLFEAGAQQLIVGRTVEEVGATPSSLNGSSLTAAGFNKALNLLKAEG